MIDLKRLLHFMGNDESLATRFLELFAQETPRQIADLQQFLSHGTWEQAHLTAHALKGQMRYLGLEELALLAEQIEKGTIQMPPPEDIYDQCALLSKNLEAVLHEIRPLTD